MSDLIKKKSVSEKTKVIKYRENPFLEDMTITKKTKQVKISTLGKDDNILVNTATGEEVGTSIVTYKAVDDEMFVKLFTANIAMTFDFTSSGIKAFSVLMYQMQKDAIKRDVVQLDEYSLEDFLDANTEKKLSSATLYRGIREMIKGQIIAKNVKSGFYFINPNFAFNGDRIAFTQIIERKKSKSQPIDENQLGLDV
jgi:hypothetical protein